MYDPIKDGIDRDAQLVVFNEAKPPANFASFVHSYWELKTESALKEDFVLHAIPDACVNVLLNQQDTSVAGITALRTTYTVLNLGKEFHYVGIQFFPGTWRGDLTKTSDGYVGTPYLGELPLVHTSEKLAGKSFTNMQPLLSALVTHLFEHNIVAVNPVTQKLLNNLENLRTVTDMASVTNLSPRQLQRNLKNSTGFSPHDFLKVVRLQQSFKQHYLDIYTDQAHFISSFRKITGYTPAKYYKKYNV